MTDVAPLIPEAARAGRTDRRIVGAILLGILAVAAAVRSYEITRDCLWFDELWHVTLSSGRGSAQLRIPIDTYLPDLADYVSIEPAAPWRGVAMQMDGVLHPPAYHLLLRGWRELFGDSVGALRGLSALLSVLAVAVMFDVGRRVLGSDRAALWAAALLAVAPGQVEQAQEARGYTLLLLLGLLAMSAALRAAASPRATAWGIVSATLMLLMVATHYFAAGFCGGLTIWAMLTLRGRVRVAFAATAFTAGAAFLLFWGPVLQAQLTFVATTADPWLADPSAAPLAQSLLRLAALPARLLIQAPVSWVTVIVGASTYAAAVYAVRRHPAVLLPALCFLGTVLMLLGLDLARTTQHLGYLRYALVASPAVVLAIVGAASGLRPGRRSLALAGVYAGCLLALPRFGYERVNLDFRPMMSALREQLADGDAIVLVSPDPAGRDAQTVYLHAAYYARTFPRPAALVTRPIDGALSEHLGRHRRVWLIAANPRTDPRRVWPGAVLLDDPRRFEPVGMVAVMSGGIR